MSWKGILIDNMYIPECVVGNPLPRSFWISLSIPEKRCHYKKRSANGPRESHFLTIELPSKERGTENVLLLL
jgi:hypothetical protein